ncbi:unnamed protein product [Lactuca virosa]|uniref:Uncharacterized protein n=1 Tax=Lactuca virosa TaxID=75947 RepID=A0AAU9NS29_9ASTR|nr:unnamed protein product [Lactuca virosa]
MAQFEVDQEIKIEQYFAAWWSGNVESNEVSSAITTVFFISSHRPQESNEVSSAITTVFFISSHRPQFQLWVRFEILFQCDAYGGSLLMMRIIATCLRLKRGYLQENTKRHNKECVWIKWIWRGI